MPYPFIQARNFTQGREGTIDLLVVHALVELAGTAEAAARLLAGEEAPRASAHYCVDGDSVVQCVRDEDVAWHAPGANHDGIGIAHAGSAADAHGWDDTYFRAMLERSARLAAEKCRRYGIPVAWLYPADLLAGRRGITSHRNVSLAFRRSDHDDPGAAFPVELYLRMVRRGLAAIVRDGGGTRLDDDGPVSWSEAPGGQLKQDPPTLRGGDEGWRVLRLQRLLALRGLDPGELDGTFGVETAESVAELQRQEGLEPDGEADPLTWRALLAGISPVAVGR